MPRKSKSKKKLSKSERKYQKIKVKKPLKKEISNNEELNILEQENYENGKLNIKDIHIPSFTMMKPGGGSELLTETDIQFIYGRKYGLIGRNGFGKTTLLALIASKTIPEIPKKLNILHIKQETPSSDKSVYKTVIDSNKKLFSLKKLEMKLIEEQKNVQNSETKSNEIHENLLKVYQKLEEHEYSSSESRVLSILAGLEFNNEMIISPTKSLSGGWRMRVSLACALFSEPDLLLLDEPTNHLDFPAVEWLIDYLKNKYEKTLVVVSHDRKFLNKVCTDVIHMEDKKLKYYKGDYETFERVRKEQRKQAKTAYDKQQATIQHNQDFIRRFRANKKLSSLAQSRIKTLNRMEKLEDVKEDYKFRFKFPKPEKLKHNEILLVDEMAFGYSYETKSEDKELNFLYESVNLRVSMESVIGVLGRNGTGKSTFVRLILGQLKPVKGCIELNQKAKIGYFAQHHSETLELNYSPYDLLKKKFPKTQHQDIYKKLGKFNLAESANKQIFLLSGGEKSRLSFAILTWHCPHILIMDEPTNHLDLDTIDGLIEAIKEYEGAVILISHDEHFLNSVCNEFWSIGPDKSIKAFYDFSSGKKFSYN